MLQLSHVSKQYSGREILHVPALQLTNDIYWVKGENGSGKSTLLKMLGGIIPFKGHITFNDRDLARHPVQYRRLIAWSDAEPLFPAFLTGWNVLKFYQRISGTENDARQLISMLRMEEYIHRKTATYSSGMLKKLSLLLVFSSGASLLLLDEPFITLDEEAVTRVSELILSRALNEGNCILMSSHQPPEGTLFAEAKQLIVAEQTVRIA